MNELLRKNITKHVSLDENQLQQFYDLFEFRTFKKKTFFILRERYALLRVSASMASFVLLFRCQ